MPSTTQPLRPSRRKTSKPRRRLVVTPAARAPQRILTWWTGRRSALIVYGVSTLFHLCLLALLAFIAITVQSDTNEITTILPAVDDEPMLIVDEQSLLSEQLAVAGDSTESTHVNVDAVADLPQPFEVDLEDPFPAAGNPLEELQVDLQALIEPSENQARNDLTGRSEQARAKLLARFGGTAESEAAVAAGLRWLARHQNEDGSWSFDHTRSACTGLCTEPGTLRTCQMGATGMALLCFLGAGQTQHEGNYKDQVRRGIEYLVNNMRTGRAGGDLRGMFERNSGMYVHALATIALCESLAMTDDRTLLRPAQQAINFIVRSQDARGGGWRYFPQQTGDTSVVGWKVMALTSGKIADLAISRRTIQLTTRFLNSVQLDGGALYAYNVRRPQARPSTTAIGLLCRMYLGWKADNKALIRGVTYLDRLGPSLDDMYHNYYATQVMHHWGGEEWERWNPKMREFLIRTQSQEGHAEGSWAPRDLHGEPGGRLYMTCLCIMTLEVYYRHLPLYQRQSVEQEF